MPSVLNTESLRAAVINFRAIRDLGTDWKTWVEYNTLQVHIVAPDGWTSRVSFCPEQNLGEQATAVLNAEYERWIDRDQLAGSIPHRNH